MILDPMYFIIVGPALLFALYAQFKVKSAFGKYRKIGVSSGMSGAQAAAEMLRAVGMNIVRSSDEARRTKNAVAIEQTDGFLGDHYDPRARTLRLSRDVYNGRSLAAVGVACHEAGHALQHAKSYAPLEIRNVMVPTAQFGSWLSFPLIFLGAILGSLGLIKVGILLFTAIVAFQIVTLPVEFNASTRAKKALVGMGIIQPGAEQRGVAAVLNAAAMTYVAAAVSSILTLLYYVMIFAGASRD